MPVYNKRGILLLPKVIVLNPKDGTYARVHILASSFFEKDHHTFGYKNYSNFREVRQVFIGFNWMNFQFVL